MFAAALGTAPLAAQTEEPLSGFSEQVAVGLVLVPAVVRSERGFVDDLDRDDFRLFVDGREVPIETFERRTDAPSSLIFLQDLSGSMGSAGKLEASRQALSYLLSRSGPGDEVAIASFAGGRTTVEVPFTDDRQVLAEAMAAWEAYGTTALHDAVAWLPEIGDGGRRGRRVAVLATDGADNASTLTPSDARALVRRAELPVYVLGLGSGSPYVLDREGQKLHRFADVLNLLARFTGGRYFPVAGPDELKEAAVTIADELDNQYVLGFTPGGSGSVTDHRLRVEVGGRHKLRVLARQGYRGTAPIASAEKD